MALSHNIVALKKKKNKIWERERDSLFVNLFTQKIEIWNKIYVKDVFSIKTHIEYLNFLKVAAVLDVIILLAQQSKIILSCFMHSLLSNFPLFLFLFK